MPNNKKPEEVIEGELSAEELGKLSGGGFLSPRLASVRIPVMAMPSLPGAIFASTSSTNESTALSIPSSLAS